jgi:hypothetical protein
MWPLRKRSIKIGKGMKLRVSKSGVRVSKRVAKGVSVSTGKSGTRLNIKGISAPVKKKKKVHFGNPLWSFWRLFK